MFSINKALGIVPNASEHGRSIDHTLEFCHWFMAVLFVGWICYFFYTIFRFHKSRNPKADYHGVQSKASAHLEFSVVLVEAVLLLGFGLPLWGKRVTGDQFPPESEALRVRVVAEQFAWNVHYPGPDGKLGKAHARFLTTSNPLGLDPNDPDGKDDVVSKGDMHLVTGQPVIIDLSSKDVIHSFSVHHMRMCQDAIPGSTIPLWFRPIRGGDFEIVCAQLCGSGHGSMRGTLKVETKEQFDAWQKELAALKPTAPAAAPAAPAAH